MRATGIVRRIDDLGRIVIPKEIRRNLKIKEGDALEIYTENGGGIILMKYSPVGELSHYAEELAQAIRFTLDKTTLICDREKVVAASGSMRKMFEKQPITEELLSAIENRTKRFEKAEDKKTAIISDGIAGNDVQIIVPIIAEGQAIGAVIILDEEAGEKELAAAELAANVLAGQLT